MKINRIVLILLLLLVVTTSLTGCGALNWWMGVDDRDIPIKPKFDPFYSNYMGSYNKIDKVLTSIDKDYALVKQEKMLVVDFKSKFEEAERILKAENALLERTTPPNGINAQYSIGFLKFSCEEGLSAIDSFKRIPQTQSVNNILKFEELLQKGIEAKETSRKYVDSIKVQVRE